jgi:hypothetical protein
VQRVPECLGQVFRIAGATTKTAIGLISSGSTGGPFKVLPVSPELTAIIAKANQGA